MSATVELVCTVCHVSSCTKLRLFVWFASKFVTAMRCHEKRGSKQK